MQSISPNSSLIFQTYAVGIPSFKSWRSSSRSSSYESTNKNASILHICVYLTALYYRWWLYLIVLWSLSFQGGQRTSRFRCFWMYLERVCSANNPLARNRLLFLHLILWLEGSLFYQNIFRLYKARGSIFEFFFFYLIQTIHLIPGHVWAGIFLH